MNAQEIVVISDSRVSSIPVQECGDSWVDLRTEFPQIKCDPLEPTVQKYSSNSFQTRREVAQRLLQAQSTLPKGVFLEIKECYRPLWVQRKFWLSYSGFLREKYPEMSPAQIDIEAAKYIAPIHVAPHSTGGAVDLTLIDEQGRPLDMGTDFNASPAKTENRTYTASAEISIKAQRNRQILVQAMTQAGFVNYPTEWWHWSYGDQYWAYVLRKPEALYSRRKPDFHLRPAQPADAMTIAEINCVASKAVYRGILPTEFLENLKPEVRLPVVQKRIANPEMSCFVAVENETKKVVGFVDVGLNRDKNIEADGEMYALYISPEFQALGAGQLLFKAGSTALKEKGFSKMMVSVFEKNESAVGFYEKMGGEGVCLSQIQIEGRMYPTVNYIWELNE